MATSRMGTPDTVAGRLGQVLTDKAVIVGGRDRAGRALSVCPKGQYLAIGGENATQYAVLMIDHTIGYIAKSDVQLLDYQVVADNTGADSGSTAAPPANASALGLRLCDTAKGYLGVPYVWGGNTTSGIDCSGFVKAVYGASGMTLPRVARDQATVGYDVPHNVATGDWRQWVPGDRMYFACFHNYIDHTAMYIGNGYFIHASAGHGHQVAIDPVTNSFYSAHLVAVRRSRELLMDATNGAPQAQTASITADPEAGQER